MKNKKLEQADYSFAAKWSDQIAERGHTALPNLLIINQVKLGITDSELVTLIGLLLHKWDENDPYPSVARLAKYSGSTQITIRRHLRSLDKKGLIERKKRSGTTNEYSLKPLINKLELYAQVAKPP